MKKLLTKPICGVVPPLITPLLDTFTLDFDGTSRLIEHVLAGGVHGVFLLGTTGEGPSLSIKVKHDLIQHACKVIAKRVPVLVGITDSSFVESIYLSEFAAECGADAVVLAPPYYFPAGQLELLEYLEELVPRLALPLFLYNMPAMTKIVIEVDTLKRAANIDGVIGFKDSGGNMVKFHEYIAAMADRPDFPILMGPEELLGESVLFGGHGGVAGGANIAPKLFVDMYNAAKSEDLATVKKLQKEIFQLRRLYQCGKYASGMIKGVKSSLLQMGICSDTMSQPFHAFVEPEKRRVEALLKEMNLIK